MRQIAGRKRVDQRGMDDLREELSIQKCQMGRSMKCWVKWAEYVERINEDLPRRVYVHQEKGSRRRGRLCMK